MATAILEDVQANERVYDGLRARLEQTHWAQWVVIAQGRLLAAAPTREEALRQAGELAPTATSRLVRQVGVELPKVARKL
jgi:hypothetical protein